jgi:hypothetical protein
MQQTFSPLGDNGGIKSWNHSIGKIGDSESIFDDYNENKFMSVLDKVGFDNDNWVSTHCWPGRLSESNTIKINQIILVSTDTSRSKLYRWIRAYHHYFKNSDAWKDLSGINLIDKARETAKNYIVPFRGLFRPNVTNIEFSEIVESSPQFLNLVKDFKIDSHLTRWRSVNNFLYETDLWNSIPVKRFHEAEVEYTTGKSYIYE